MTHTTMLEDGLELKGGVEVAKDIERKIKTTGIRGLDIGKAKELGVFHRISLCLTAIHSTITAAYRIYGDVDYMMSELGARRHEIGKIMNEYERAFDKFFRFWTDYYVNNQASKEMIEEVDSLHRYIMEWAKLPLNWQLGDPQRLPNKDATITVKDDRDLYFYQSTVDTKLLEDAKETWAVTKYDVKTKQQTTINTEVDKPSAMMIAKRLSNDDKENVYLANVVREIKEQRTDVIPFKAYRNNTLVGSVK